MNDSKPFFHDGKLRVTIPSANVRWIDFLTHSRLLNSKQGGWDTNKHWRKQGLEQLADAKFIEHWTTNSLKKNTFPRPRPKDFRLGRDFTNDRNRSADLCDPDKIGTCSENSLNARLFQNYGASPPGSTSDRATNPFSMPLLAYEVPLCDDSDGQLKIDLLACDGSDIQIIELKQAKNTNNSPLMALVEGICYGLQLWRCRDAIIEENSAKFGLNPGHFKKLRLTIAAPQAYWGYWGCPGGRNESVEHKMKQILANVSRAKALKGTVLELGGFCAITGNHLKRP